MRISITVSVLFLLTASLTGFETQAQRTMYRCTTDGRASLSDRPCEGRPATGLASIGPVREARSGQSPSWGSPQKASDFLDHLSPLCAELNEGLRNGPGRGLGHTAMSELRTSYRERCSDDEQAARKRLAEEQSKHRDARESALAADRREIAHVKLSREQCDEMYRIAAARRKKLDTMSGGEREDFERFQANWKSRCPPA